MYIEDCIYNTVCDYEHCSTNCIRYRLVNTLLKYSNLPMSLRGINKLVPESVDLDAFNALAEISADIYYFVRNGGQLYIYGGPGNGKTTWSAKLMLNYFDNIWKFSSENKRGIFINVPELLYQSKQSISRYDENIETLKNDILEADLVIFDDIATSNKVSNYDYDLLYVLINKRIAEGKSNIYTSNASPKTLSTFVGSRLSDRILASTNIIELRGKSRR